MTQTEKTTKGTLYGMDCSFFSYVSFTRLSLDSTRFFFSDFPECEFPAQFFLMPESREHDYRAFIYTLQEKPKPCAGRPGYYQADGVTDDIPELQSNFRVYVSFETSLWLDGDSREYPITVKDIGSGGFLFIAKQPFTAGDTFSTFLVDRREPVFIHARIQKRRPVRRDDVFGYGCQFLDLTPKAESAIRKYVYQTETLQAKIHGQKS